MPHVVAPLLTATAFLVGSLHAYGRPPLSIWGEAYAHVPMHLVGAGTSVLVAGGVLSLARCATTSRARRAAHWCAGGWMAVATVFALEAWGATIGNGYGENTLHDTAALLLAPAALGVLVMSLLVVATRGGARPWSVRLAPLISAPGVPFLTEAASPAALAVGTTAAVLWSAAAVVVVATRSRQVVSPPQPRTSLLSGTA